MDHYKSKLKYIRCFIFDYDGVLTDGHVILLPDGDALRTANVKDGYALQLAAKKGFHIAIISGGNSQSMVRRFEALRIKDFFLGIDNKIEVFNSYLQKKGLDKKSVAYMGDDIPDLKPMQEAGFACCPSDASPEIKAVSHYVSPFSGGRGCVRDVIEQTLKIQGEWLKDDAFHW
ncbi:MAG: HAD-IIIA family hydrolase [Bacteroidales bacterium]|nr:HAD-IIIA family hydrolase [Bacteroidales bacterium]